jgi:hypothetical protein
LFLYVRGGGKGINSLFWKNRVNGMLCLFSKFLTCFLGGTHPSFMDVNVIWSSAKLPV